MITFGITILLFILLTIGTPVAFSLITAGSIGLYLVGGWEAVTGVLSTTPLSSVASYELISVPMFLLMAEFVIMSGVADNLFKAAATWVGRVPGGLGMATALAGAGFGAISGSSTASAATLSSTTMPAMLKQGYEPKLAGGVVAISGTLAMLIPPSIALVLYGIIADVSIGALLIGGVIPGILVTFTIMATVWVLVTLDPKSAPRGRAYSMREKLALAQGRRADAVPVHGRHRRHLHRRGHPDRGLGPGRVRCLPDRAPGAQGQPREPGQGAGARGGTPAA